MGFRPCRHFCVPKLIPTREQIEAVHAPGPTAVEILEEAGAEAEANAGGATERLDTPEHPRWFIVRFWEQVKSDEKRREAAEAQLSQTRGSKPS